MSKIILNSQDLSDRVRHVMKIKQENNVTDYTNAGYAENDIK